MAHYIQGVQHDEVATLLQHLYHQNVWKNIDDHNTLIIPSVTERTGMSKSFGVPVLIELH